MADVPYDDITNLLRQNFDALTDNHLWHISKLITDEMTARKAKQDVTLDVRRQKAAEARRKKAKLVEEWAGEYLRTGMLVAVGGDETSHRLVTRVHNDMFSAIHVDTYTLREELALIKIGKYITPHGLGNITGIYVDETGTPVIFGMSILDKQENWIDDGKVIKRRPIGDFLKSVKLFGN